MKSVSCGQRQKSTDITLIRPPAISQSTRRVAMPIHAPLSCAAFHEIPSFPITSVCERTAQMRQGAEPWCEVLFVFFFCARGAHAGRIAHGADVVLRCRFTLRDRAPSRNYLFPQDTSVCNRTAQARQGTEAWYESNVFFLNVFKCLSRALEAHTPDALLTAHTACCDADSRNCLFPCHTTVSKRTAKTG